MGVLLLGLCRPLWFFEGCVCWLACCLVGNFPEILLCVATGASRKKKWVSRYQNLNSYGDGLRSGAEWIHRKEESRMFLHDLLSPLEMRQRIRRDHNR